MTREFEDTEGNTVVDIEYRLTFPAVIAALIRNGTLTADDIESASDYRILDVTEQRAKQRALRETEERRLAEEEAKALKNKTPEQKAAANEFTAEE
jgi:hypothetical protein